MYCIDCDSVVKTKVIETVVLDSNVVIRRHKCKECNSMFYTREEYINEYDYDVSEFKKKRWAKL